MICFPGLDDFGNGRIVDRNVAHPRQPQRLDSGANAGRFLLTHALYCSGIIVRRDVYERIGAFDESLRYSADEEYWLRVAASFPVQYDPVRICVYRRGGVNSMMGTWTRPEFAALYRETLRKGLEHFQAIGSESHQELVRLAGLRMTRNWVVIAFLCLCDGEPHLATHYLDQYTKDRQGLPPDVREHIVRVLAALPRRISRTICRSLLRALTSKFALVGSRLVPR
jgi:hypothetical protein